MQQCLHWMLSFLRQGNPELSITLAVHSTQQQINTYMTQKICKAITNKVTLKIMFKLMCMKIGKIY